MELANGQLAEGVTYTAAIKDGKLKVELVGDANLFLDKLKAAIPGKFDDLIIEALKGMLK